MSVCPTATNSGSTFTHSSKPSTRQLHQRTPSIPRWFPLRARGATAIEAIKVVDVLFALKYPEGKIALHRSPAWADITRSAEAVHDAAEKAARALADE
jgi:hypothetical protein